MSSSLPVGCNVPCVMSLAMVPSLVPKPTWMGSVPPACCVEGVAGWSVW
jgi:hypothetical protein